MKRRGYVYAKGSRLYLAWYDANGKRRLQAAGLPVGQEEEAERRLRALQEQVAASMAAAGTGPLTLRAWAATWIKRRKKRGVKTVRDDETRLRLHILPELGDMPLADLRPRHVREWLDEVKGKPLAPKTIRNIYGTLSACMKEAVVDELIAATPCVLIEGDLPAKGDADPTWRHTAIYTREEVELLISDRRIPQSRRVAYALMALAGLRSGEMASLRWRDYDREVEPLGRLTISTAYSTSRKRVDTTKTVAIRLVPVHPTLAAILAEAKGDASPDDLISPSSEETLRTAVHTRRNLHRDLARLGMRRRRVHDLRRTFISLARGSGASKDLVRWITHTPRGADVIDGYTTLEWQALCRIVQGIRVELRRPEGQVIQLRQAAGSATALLPPESGKDKAPKSLGKSGPQVAGRTGLEPVATPDRKMGPSGVSMGNHEAFPGSCQAREGTNGEKSGASGSSAATVATERQIRAALARLDRPQATALLRRLLADLE